MPESSKFNDLLTEVGHLSLDEQSELMRIIQRRPFNARREELLLSIAEGKLEFEQGLLKATTADVLMRELKL